MADENSVLEKFEENIDFHNGRYTVKLPIRESHEVLGDNYFVSENRLKTLANKFKNDKKLLHDYYSIIQDQQQANIIERAPGDYIVGKTHYLPRKAVVKENKTTTKTRMVFDASSKAKGCVSLNDCLETGPSLTSKLFDVLTRFRAHNVAFVGDIEKAFLQIEISQEQRDLLRFLWFEDIENIDYQNFENNKLVEYRLCSRVLFGASPSPFCFLSRQLYEANNGFSQQYNHLVLFQLCLLVVDLG